MKTAIILGATGLTGGKLLQLLLHDDRYGTIKLFSRSSAGIENPKVEEYLGNLFNMDSLAANFTGDEVFCCIGTTKAKTPDTKLYKKIDYGIPVAAAKLSKRNGIGTFLVISGVGADAKSSIFYNRTKGEMEEAVLDIGMPKTCIMQPSLIGGERNEKRTGELIFKKLMNVLNYVMIGPLQKYRSIRPDTIAKGMLWLANNSCPKIRIASDEIQEIAER